MSRPADCQILGRWRIVENDTWDDDCLDLVDPAAILFEPDGRGEFAFGCIQAGMDLEYGRTIVFFRWAGCDEGDEVTGSGSAEVTDDGALQIELSFDNADEAVLTARRE
ncbi:hypothetical protein [Roseospirillum parvum]|uniref:Protease inhibitor Inh n=2 Tax=Roseospirillum parvum TaxID=83401 RepID=A0A1G8GMZ7_9PROT|nr:hypothetical protein [Roseospirillum parvum]SDH95676.1 hypothetical protein SAMN05421742_1332 [Roseospirillum parvum]